MCRGARLIVGSGADPIDRVALVVIVEGAPVRGSLVPAQRKVAIPVV